MVRQSQKIFACFFLPYNFKVKKPRHFYGYIMPKNYNKYLNFHVSRTFISIGESSPAKIDVKQLLRLQTLSFLSVTQRRLLYPKSSNSLKTLPFFLEMLIFKVLSKLSKFSGKHRNLFLPHDILITLGSVVIFLLLLYSRKFT